MIVAFFAIQWFQTSSGLSDFQLPMSEDSVAQLEDASDEDEYVVRVLALVAGYYGHTYFDKQPLRNSITTGSDWVAELIEGNHKRIIRSYRMT